MWLIARRAHGNALIEKLHGYYSTLADAVLSGLHTSIEPGFLSRPFSNESKAINLKAFKIEKKLTRKRTLVRKPAPIEVNM